MSDCKLITNYQKVAEFHKCVGHPIHDQVQFDIFDENPKRVNLRLSLIKEEFKELCDAIAEDNMVEMIDALSDMLYVIYGAGLEFGIDLNKYYRLNGFKLIRKKSFDNYLIKLWIELLDIQMNKLEDAIKNKNMTIVGHVLENLIFKIYGLGYEFGIDLEKAFDLVHKSNMTKFCISEEQAQETVKNYIEKYKQNKSPYEKPTFRKSGDDKHWIVFDQVNDKILKSIYYSPVDLNGI